MTIPIDNTTAMSFPRVAPGHGARAKQHPFNSICRCGATGCIQRDGTFGKSHWQKRDSALDEYLKTHSVHS